MPISTGIITGGDSGGSVRAIWWCGYDRMDFYEPRGERYWAPVVGGDQTHYCLCGRKLRRLSS